jgi:hypothetical protein
MAVIRRAWRNCGFNLKRSNFAKVKGGGAPFFAAHTSPMGPIFWDNVALGCLN